MEKIAHYKTFYFLRYAHVRYVKSLFTNIQNNRICEKLANFLRNLQTSRINNSRILRIKNAKFSGHCFFMNVLGYFKICISVPLMVICPIYDEFHNFLLKTVNQETHH